MKGDSSKEFEFKVKQFKIIHFESGEKERKFKDQAEGIIPRPNLHQSKTWDKFGFKEVHGQVKGFNSQAFMCPNASQLYAWSKT